jgi:calcineurin-like phosphoesterase family protein
MTTYFTSDLHLYHRLVAGIRGFWQGDGEPGPDSLPDVDEHNFYVAKAWSVVKPDDIVWVQGDICVSAKWWPFALEFIKNLPGRKRLVNGNHDPVSSIHREAWKYQRQALEVFDSVQDFAKIKLNGRYVLLSHYPYSGTGSEGMNDHGQPRSVERYTEFRLPDCGFPLIHGHTHGTEKLHFSDAGTPQIHVGMDAWHMKLVSQHEIEKILEDVTLSVK